jgi:hypothetical protein
LHRRPFYIHCVPLAPASAVFAQAATLFTLAEPVAHTGGRYLLVS